MKGYFDLLIGLLIKKILKHPWFSWVLMISNLGVILYTFITTVDELKNMLGYEYLILIAVTGGGLFFAMRAKNNYFESKETKYKNLSVVGVMLQKRGALLYATITLIIAAILAYLASIFVLKLEVNNYVFIFFIGVVAFAYTRDVLFEFRVRSGMYGANEKEAREIIRFILNNSEDIDDDDKGGPRKILKKEDLFSIETELYGNRVKGYAFAGTEQQ